MIYETNEWNKEVLNTKDMVKVIAYLLISQEENKLERLNNAIYNTYTRDDAIKICNIINQALTVAA